MAGRRKEEPMKTVSRSRRPATTPEARENQVIALAYDLAEKQIIEGTASSQVITHFLKLGTTRERLEQEKLAHETALLQKRTEEMASAARVEELYTRALKSMRSYSGQPELDSSDDGY